tara:strand:+ start:289 stop:417 length:129 start_codon:yes stop_codon:yes gene_type:complete
MPFNIAPSKAMASKPKTAPTPIINLKKSEGELSQGPGPESFS